MIQESQTKQFKVISSPYFLFSIITLLGFFFRIDIGKNVSMHTDEGQFAYVTSINGIFNLYKYIAEFTSRDQPIFMYLVTYGWKCVAGTGPEALRLLPAILSSLGIFFSGFFCVRLTKSKFMSVSLAILVAVSPFSVRYAYDLTPYALVGLLATVSFFIFLEHLRDKTYVPSVWLILVNILFLNTHYYAFFIVTAQMLIFIFMMIRARQFDSIKHYTWAGLIYFVCAMIPMILLFNPSIADISQGWMRMFKPDLFNDIIIKTIGLYEPVLMIERFLFSGILIGYFAYKFKSKTWIKGYLIPIIFYFSLSIIVTKFIESFTWPFLGHYRYLMILFPTLFFLILVCIDEIKIRYAKHIMVALIAGLFLTDTIKNQPHINQDFNGAFSYLHQTEKDKPFVLFFLPSGYNKPLSLYYSKYYALKNTIILDNHILEPEDKTGLPNLVAYMNKNAITKSYLMAYYLNEMKAMKDITLERLNKVFDIQPAKDFHDINLFEMKLKTTLETPHAK